MSFTIQQLVDRARVPLNDSDKDRYSDAQLLVFAQDAYLSIVRHRPDVFIGGYATLPLWSSLGLTTAFPSIGDEYMPIIADFITSRAEMLDDEFVNSGRAAQFMTMFGTGLGSP